MFKTFIFSCYGNGILAEDFETIEQAKQNGERYILGEDSYYQVRQYLPGSFVSIIGGEQDTGMIVFDSKNSSIIEKRGKVKNVVKGYLSKYDIEEITFFKGDECIYSGTLYNFEKVRYDTDKYLWEVKEKILNSDCIKCILHNSSKLFIFF